MGGTGNSSPITCITATVIITYDFYATQHENYKITVGGIKKGNCF